MLLSVVDERVTADAVGHPVQPTLPPGTFKQGAFAKEPPPVGSAEWLGAFFQTLRLPGLGISALDDALGGFAQLRELNVSNYRLRELRALPARSLQVLHAYDNSIAALETHTGAERLRRLVHLGLGYNCLRDVHDLLRGSPSPAGLAQRFPAR